MKRTCVIVKFYVMSILPILFILSGLAIANCPSCPQCYKKTKDSYGNCGCADKCGQNQGCCNGQCYDYATQGCCNGQVYNFATQECCNNQVKNKGNCMACIADEWLSTCDPGSCETCQDGICKMCGWDPTKCCDNGQCKECCKAATTGNCEGHNSDCGCDPLGSGDCSGKIKEWTIGQTNYCWSECGGTPCFDDVVNVNCYAWRACATGSTSVTSICISGLYCQPTGVGFCQTCIPNINEGAHIVQQMDCQCD